MKKVFALVLSIIMLAGTAAAVFSADESPFSDVKTSRWSFEAIQYAVEKGYMNGVGEGRFDPAGSMTRGMVVTVLYRREGSPEITFRDDFTDVKAGKYYSDAVIWAKDEGVVNGITETTFEPNGKITREQLATMLSRFSERCLVSVPERADLSGYPDADKIHSYARDALAWANEANLIKGMSDGTLSPRGEATREQFATILKRFDDTFNLVYNEPVVKSHYTEPEYPLVENADVYVAVGGNDGNDGSFDHPVATFNRAVEKVREIKQTKTSGDIVVAFKAGDYGPLCVELTAEDSGTPDQRIIYCKYGDGDVTFNNGLDVTADEFVPLDEEDKALFLPQYADSIKKADVSAKLSGYDPTTCMILSENGVMNLARFPNIYPDGTDHLVQAGVAYDHEHIHIRHRLFKNRIEKYHSVDGLILYGYIAAGWYKDMVETDGYEVDEETGNYVFFVPHPENVYCGYGPQLGDGFASDYFQMAILNVSEELDAPGEFWVDVGTGTFYVYEPSGDYHFVGGESAQIQVTDFYYTKDEEGGMITLGEDVGYITLRGLGFRNSNKYMIRGLSHPRGLTVDRCSFAGCSARNMIDIQASKEGEPLDLLITGCEFSSGAGRAAAVFIPDSDDLYSDGYLFTTGGNVVIENNYVTLTGLKIGNLGAICVRVPDPLVSHNHFERCFWQCVDINQSKGAVVEYNVFDNVCCNGDDTAAIGQSCNFGGCGNFIRYNLFMNIGGGQNGRFGIYLDNAIGTTVVSNLFYNTRDTVCNNDICKYNAYCDNAVVLGPIGCGYDTWHTEAVEEAVASGDLTPVQTFWTYQRWLDIFAFFDAHPDIKEQMEAEWPGFFDITTDFDSWDKSEFCENSSLVITGNRSIDKTIEDPEFNETLVKYSTIEDNLCYLLDENPLFVNPTIGDYRIRESVDFPDIEFEKIGRY